MYIVIDKNGTTQKSKVVATYHESVYLPENLSPNEAIRLSKYEYPPFVNVPFGKEAILFVNLETEELYYEFEDRPLTSDEELQQLKERQELLQQALDDLLLQGGM